MRRKPHSATSSWAIQEPNALLSRETPAVIQGDPGFARFDVLLHLAQENKERAKYAWITRPPMAVLAASAL